MIVTFAVAKEVNTLSDIPKDARISHIDGVSVAGICVYCDFPIYDDEDYTMDS